MEQDIPPNVWYPRYPRALDVVYWVVSIGSFGAFPQFSDFIFGHRTPVIQFLIDHLFWNLGLVVIFCSLFAFDYFDMKKNTYVKKVNGKWYRLRRISIKV